MGGKPIMAIAILGWPINTLAPEIARKVIEGGRFVCQQAGISLAGGHSIDAPEPIFGLAVTGIVPTDRVKKNSSATAGCKLFLTKPLGIGVLTTAEKKSLLKPEHYGLAAEVMCQLNKPGAEFADIEGVTAMTDVTGFGLLGHLSEMCQGAGVQAEVWFDKVPKLPDVEDYIAQGCVPGGTARNFASYGSVMGDMTQAQRDLLCDPQTSGGLLLAVKADAEAAVAAVAEKNGIKLTAIGELKEARAGRPMIEIR
jgi:selenide,water dikinase